MDRKSFLLFSALLVAFVLNFQLSDGKDMKIFPTRAFSRKTSFLPHPNTHRHRKNLLAFQAFLKTIKRKQNRKRRGAVNMRNPWSELDIEVVKEFISNFPKLKWLLEQNHEIIRKYVIAGVGSLGRDLGVTRKTRLWCRSGIGYHLEINKRGRVVARHKPTADGLLEMVSIRRGVVGIRSVASTQRYICMNRKGRIVTKTKYHRECAFRENREANKFDTYSSDYYSNHSDRKGFFLGIAANGKVKRMKRYSWWQKRAQWLPRPP